MSEDKELSQHMSGLMNPRVRVVEVGIRALRKVTIYPLSVSDQFSLNDLINQGLKVYFEEAEKTQGNITPVLVSKLIDLIRAKLPTMLKLIIPDEDIKKLLKDLDNEQLATIAEHVFTVNYGDPVKKLASLFSQRSQVTPESALERLTRLSAGTTPATDLNTSPDSVSEKVESPKAN